MKAFNFFLIFAIFLPFSLIAAPDSVAGIMEGSQEVAADNKITMITDKFGVSVPTLIAQMVNFCLVALVLYYFAVKPISTTLEERQQKISDGLQYAEEILAEAREQSKERIEVKTQEAAAQAEAIIRKASEATELERQKMLADVRQEVARLVVATSSKVLSRDLSDAEKSTFSESAAKELAS